MKTRLLSIILVALAIAAESSPSLAQRNRKTVKSKPQSSRSATDAPQTLVGETKKYKQELEVLLKLLEPDVKIASENLEKSKELLAQNIISKRELEESEQNLVKAQAKVDEVRKRLAEADHVFAEMKALEQLAKLPPVRLGGYRVTSALIRYNGPAAWFLTDAAKVQGYFSQRFGRGLPVSAFGQTATHDRLGFDHRNAIDVALHPDSAEGQSLMAYLRSAGIPFIAFRQAVAGSATGPHIHIGQPSRRIR